LRARARVLADDGKGRCVAAPATEPTPTPSTKFPLVKFLLAGASTESSEEEEAAADDPFGWVGNTWNDTVKAVGSMIGGTPNPSSVAYGLNICQKSSSQWFRALIVSAMV
jgi:hypothetical protein